MSSAPLNQQQFDPGITQSYTGDLRRIVNRDGSFNVRRKGWSLKDLHVYQLLLSLSWPAFMGLVLALFIFINGIFAGLYAATGLGNLAGAEAPTRIETLLNAFFFSVQTLTTVGYGTISPKGIATNALASIEAMLGVMGFAFAAGLFTGGSPGRRPGSSSAIGQSSRRSVKGRASSFASPTGAPTRSSTWRPRCC